MYTEWTYLVYLAVSVSLTIWVARTLFKNGRVFLVDAFSGNETLADSVNHLLVVGFYLINVGFVTVALKYGDKPGNLVGAIEFASMKIGLVLLAVGAMHFFNLYLLAQARKRGLGTRPRKSDPPHDDEASVSSTHGPVHGSGDDAFAPARNPRPFQRPSDD